ncbi:MAG TPA: glutamine synthetase, partial [Dongiaceae bacterium]|nr:glutamine synthetase [Dongiaceae bacterium]
PVTAGSGPDQPLSPVAGQFVAGVLAHLPALCAVVAPGVVSYLRLVPHHWSAAYGCFGRRNREAALRLCPVLEFPGMDQAAQANVEFRPADAAASPYLVLGALVRAGLDGIRRKLPTPPLVAVDPHDMDAAERERLAIRRLPTSLAEALAALDADAAARGWFDPILLECYLAIKRSEMALCEGLGPAELCAKYAEVY